MEDEFIGIINYAIMALIQINVAWSSEESESVERLEQLYLQQIAEVKALMENKNYDYAEAWRMMRLSSIIDIILMKVYRTKSIEQNAGNTLISEGVTANYQDMINYSIFALIKLEDLTL